MEQTKPSLPHTKAPFSLADWAKQHITTIFEATSVDDALRAIDSTFSRNVQVHLNGSTLEYAQVRDQVLEFQRNASKAFPRPATQGLLKVRWKELLESEDNDPNTHDGRVGGYYLIEGLQKATSDNLTSEGPPTYKEFVRHKSFAARIVTEPIATTDPPSDGRRIVEIFLIARDVPVTET